MKRRGNNTGLSVLTITIILSVVSLTYSLTAYRGIFYQIKVAKNELQARQAHWKAEGGLECAFHYITQHDKRNIPTNLSVVCQKLGLDYLGRGSFDPDQLMAVSGQVKVTKDIEFPSYSGVSAPSLKPKWKQGSWNDQ